MNILFDADIFLYHACTGVEELYIWEQDLHTLVSDAREARQRMESDLHGVQKRVEQWLSAKLTPILCFSGANNWRKLAFPFYKANRIFQRRPIAFRSVKEWFIKNWDCRVWEGLEADDVLGILSTRDENDNIIISEDKDLKGIPGWLYNPAKDDHPKLISLEQADHFHMFQALTGDKVDGYPGCPDIGPVKALQALGEPGKHSVPEMWERVLRLYRRSLGGLDDALADEIATTQAKVARILREGEWDFEKKECLWNPPVIAAGQPQVT